MTQKVDTHIQGMVAEDTFLKMAKKREYSITIATKNQNIREHTDVYISKNNVLMAIDIKSAKRENRLGQIQDEWHVLEFIAVTYPKSNYITLNKTLFDPLVPDFSIGSGRNGWLYGKATHIAFELQYVFLIVPRINLIHFSSENIEFSKFVQYPQQAKYCVYSRDGRGDLISYIHKKDLYHLSTEKWHKPILLNM
jgi:hypothetical protein